MIENDYDELMKDAQITKESKICAEKWGSNLPSLRATATWQRLDNYGRASLSVLLENQSIMNDYAISGGSKEDRPKLLQLVADVYPSLIANKIVSVQPMLGPCSLVYYMKKKYEKKSQEIVAIESEEIVARTRKLKAFALDDENLASQIIKEMNGEVIKDLSNNAGTIATAKPRQAVVREGLFQLRNAMSRKGDCNRPNWLVVNSHRMNNYEDLMTEIMEDWKMDVWVDDHAEDMLMGFRGKSFLQAGYFLCPYVPFTTCPVVKTKDGQEKHYLLTRYGKKLLRSGSKMYGKLVIDWS